MSLFVMSTSHRIEHAGPGRLRKDLSDDALIGDARWARPAFLYNAAREPAVYRDILAPRGVGPTLIDSGQDWVLLEHIPGIDLWQVGELDTWCRVMAWTAGLHRRLEDARACAVPLVRYNRSMFELWWRRASWAGAPAAVLDAHRQAAERLAALPATIIHGDLYPSNVLLSGEGIWAIDWELAGLGPAVLDLAALSAGRWPAAAQWAMARAYFDATGMPQEAWTDWCRDLDAARLHLCVQWLGWSPGWQPPAQHAHDWLSEALALAADWS